MKLSENLNRLIEEKGLTLAKLSEMSGVPKSTIHSWTANQKSLNLEQLRLVCEALETPLHDICFGGPDPFHEEVGIELKKLFEGDIRVRIDKIIKR